MQASTRVAALCSALCACVALAACGGSDSTGPSVANVGGNWQLAATISNATLGISCQAAGLVSIAQSGANFTGQVSGSNEVCTGPGGTSSSSVDGPLTGGQISGNAMTYSDGTCSYSGTITGTPPNRVSGPVSCTFSYQGQNYPFNGTWQVTR